MPKRSRSISDVVPERSSPPKRSRTVRRFSTGTPNAHIGPLTSRRPLTVENLTCHTCLPENQATSWFNDACHDDEAAGSPVMSNRSEAKPPSVDSEHKLAFYRIYLNRGKRPPKELYDFIEDVIKAPRQSCSPNAARIAKQQRTASRLAEKDGINLLINHLLFQEESPDHEQGVPRLSRKIDMNLERIYLPPPYNRTLLKEFGPLEQPQPDTSIGYRTTREELLSPEHAAFNEMQEFTLAKRTISPTQHFPFLTAQWKSPRNGGTIYDANLQSARDGATIVNYLHTFYDSASRAATVVDTAHFSLTVDMYTVYLNVHWRQEVDGAICYYMEDICYAFLKDAAQISVLRAMLRNILEHAMGTRLDNIKNTINGTGSQKRGPTTLSVASASDSGVHIPLTPGSLIDGHRPSKKLRADDALD